MNTNTKKIVSKSYSNLSKKSEFSWESLSQVPATAMDCCGKGSSSVSISGNGGGERLKAEAEAAVRALDNNNNNNQVILNIETSIYVLKGGD